MLEGVGGEGVEGFELGPGGEPAVAHGGVGGASRRAMEMAAWVPAARRSEKMRKYSLVRCSTMERGSWIEGV